MPGEHLVAGDAEGIEIAGRADIFSLYLLGTHVQGRTHRNANLREVDCITASLDARQTEISHFDFAAIG